MSVVQSRQSPGYAADIDVVEAQLAARIVCRLADPVDQLAPDIVERLRVARGQALTHARHQPAPIVAGGRAQASAVFGRLGAWWPWLGAAAPVAALVIGLSLLNASNDRERVLAAAEIDTALLADQLPPDAYADPGFAAFLKLSAP